MAEHGKTKALAGEGRPSAKPRKGKGLWILIILVIAIVTPLVLSGWMQKPPVSDAAKAASTFTVRMDDLIITVTESGSIKAQQSTDVICEVEDRSIEIASIIAEGSMITAEDVANGKIICQLNSTDLQDRYNRELIDYSASQANYLEAQEFFIIQKKQNESDIAAAQLALEFGLMDLQNYLGQEASEKLVGQVTEDPNAPIDFPELLKFLEDPDSEGGGAKQKLKELNDSIILAEQKLTQAQSELESTKKLYDANYAPEIEVRQKELAVNSYRIQHEQASDALSLYKRYDLPKQTKQLLSDYHEAERELERTGAQTRSRLAQARVRLERTEAAFNLQKDHVAKLEREIEACTIRAPSPGIVIYGSSADWYQRRDDPIEVGDSVRRGQKIFTIPNSNLMGVELRVHEAFVNMVMPGQPVTVTVEAFPDTPFYGKVSKVAPLPDPQHGWFDPGVKVYTTQVTIDGSHEILKPGMSAKVEILAEHLRDVLIVPVQVVANRSGRKVCYVATGGDPEEREVVTGAFNDTFVEIVSGLEVGEEILLSPPRLVEPENPSQPNRLLQPQQRQEQTEQENTDSTETPAKNATSDT